MTQSVPRLIGAWVLVMAVVVSALSALDHVPGLLAGTTRRARVYSSIEEAERAVGARLWLPGYYPDEWRWPPARVEASASGPVSVSVRIAGRGGGERLVIVQSIEGPAAPPPALLSPGEVMETTDVTVAGRPARLVRRLVGTRRVHDLSWDQGGRRVTLRHAGPVQQLLLTAHSLAGAAR